MSKPATPEFLFDARTVDRHIKEGRTTQAEYDAFLASLPDEADEAVDSDVRFVVRGRLLATSGIVEEEDN